MFDILEYAKFATDNATKHFLYNPYKDDYVFYKQEDWNETFKAANL